MSVAPSKLTTMSRLHSSQGICARQPDWSEPRMLVSAPHQGQEKSNLM